MIVALMTIGVKGTAFLKELVVAERFGTSDAVDAFVVAMLIPSIIALAIGNAFRDALLPVYAKLRLRSAADSAKLTSNTIWICGGVLASTTLAVMLFGDPLMGLMCRGFSPEKAAMSAEFLRWVAVYMLCVGVGNILKGYLQAHERFAIGALAPVTIPGFTILLLFVLPGPVQGVWLAYGTAGGAGALLILLGCASRRLEDKPLLQRPAMDDATRSVMRHIFPLLAGTMVLESYLFVDTMMVTPLPPGNVAVLTYGERIAGVFCLVGIAAVQSLFPHISDLVARESWQRLIKTVLGYSGLIVLCSLPVVVICWSAPEPIVSFVFERGEFTAQDTAKVAQVLQFAGLQVPGAVLLGLGTRVVMALQANYIVLLFATSGLVVNIFLNTIFIRWYGVQGVALSTAAVNLLSAAFLYFYAGLRLKRLAHSANH